MKSEYIEKLKQKQKEWHEEKKKGAIEIAPRVKVSPTFVSGGSGGSGGGQNVSVRRSPIPASVKGESKTDVQLAKEKSDVIKDIRKSAGVFGKGLSEVQERGIIKKYIAEQQPKQIGRVRTGAKAVIEDDRVTLPLQTGQLTISKGEEKPRKLITYKDIAWRESFFPSGRRDVAKARRKKEGKVTLPTYIEIKTGRLSDALFKKLKIEEFGRDVAKTMPPTILGESVVKPSIIKLTSKDTRVPVHEFIKVGLFAPAFSTPVQSLRGQIAKGKVPAETRVTARVRKIKRDVIDVDVISETQLGKKRATGLSTQSLKEIDEKLTAGISRGFVSEDSGKLITEIKGVGGVKEIGIAKRVQKGIPDKEIGRGVFGRTFFKETGKMKVRRGIRIGVPERELVDVGKLSKRKQDVTAVFGEGQDDIIRFVGTQKPITRVSLSKVSKIIKEPEITGKIGYGKFPSMVGEVYAPKTKLKIQTPISIFPQSKKGQIQMTSIIPKIPRQTGIEESIRIRKATLGLLDRPSLKTSQFGDLTSLELKAVKKSVIEQTSMLSGQAEKGLSKGLSKSLTSQRLIPTLSSVSRFKTPTISKLKSQTIQKTRQRPQTTLVTKTPTILKTRMTPISKQVSKIKQVQIPKFKFKRTSIPKIITPDINILKPDIPIVPVMLFPFGKGKKKKGKDESGREGFGISEGFVAKTFGFKPVTIKEKDLSKLVSETGALGIRRGIILK